MYDIYLIKNNINNKLYVGQTRQGYITRFRQHIKLLKSNESQAIHKAIKKYGKSNFFVELIETCNSLDELNEREEFWIKHYDSYHYGYNLCMGGNQPRKPKIKIPKEILDKIIEDYKNLSLRQISVKYNFGITVIKNHLEANNIPILSRNKTSLNLSDQDKSLIAKLYQDGFTTIQISNKLNISERTVRRYKSC